MLNFYTPNEKKINFLINFLVMKNFNHMSEVDFLKNRNGGLVVFDYQVSLKTINKTLELLNNNKKNLIVLFLPKHLKKTKFKDSEYEIIFYPTPIDFFEKNLKIGLVQKKISYKDIMLGDEGAIININNEKKTYLTEMELRIFNFLLKNKTVSKNNFKTQVLNLKITIDTRSLESHLSRIRKKIKAIESKIKIISIDQEHIQIS